MTQASLFNSAPHSLARPADTKLTPNVERVDATSGFSTSTEVKKQEVSDVRHAYWHRYGPFLLYRAKGGEGESMLELHALGASDSNYPRPDIQREYQILELTDGQLVAEFLDNGERRVALGLTSEAVHSYLGSHDWREVKA